MRFAHMTALADRIDRLVSGIGRVAAWLILVVVLLQFALVVPDWPESVRIATRVPAQVRALLRVTLYAVDDAGALRIVED